MKTLIVIFLALITTQLNSQSLLQLYDDYIPKSLIHDNETRNTIETNLNYNANIHPDLIYYYVNHLISFYEKKVTNPDSNYLNLLKFYRNQFVAERSKWALFQIKDIEQSTDVQLKRNKMGKFFEELLNTPQQDIKDATLLKKDSNLLEYFNYLFFTQEKSTYNAKIDYYQLNQKIAEDYVNLMTKEYNNFDGLNSDQKINKIKKDIKYWFLVDGIFQNKYKSSINYQVSELSIKTFNKSFLTKNNFFLGITVNGFIPSLKQHNTFQFENKPLPTFIEPITHDFPIILNYHPLLSAEIGYQLALKTELGMFSYLKFKLGYTMVLCKYEDQNKDNEFYSFTYRIISSNEKAIYVYKSVSAKNERLHAGYVKISAPVFYFNKNFYFEFGLDLAPRLVKFDYQVQKQSVIERNGIRTVESIENINLPFKETKLAFSPSLAFIIEPTENFNISFNNAVVWEAYLLALSVDYKF